MTDTELLNKIIAVLTEYKACRSERELAAITALLGDLGIHGTHPGKETVIRGSSS